MKLVAPGQLDQKNPGTWPIYYKVLVWFVIAVLMIFLYKNFVYDDLISIQADNQRKIESLKADYQKFYQYKVDLPLYKEQQKQLKGILVDLLKILPSQTEMPNLIDQIYYASTQNGLNFAKLIPANQKKEKYYNTQPILLTTTVDFHSFRKFAEQINTLSRIVNLTKVNISTVKGYETLLSIETNLETYIYNQDLSVFGLGGEK